MTRPSPVATRTTAPTAARGKRCGSREPSSQALAQFKYALDQAAIVAIDRSARASSPTSTTSSARFRRTGAKRADRAGPPHHQLRPPSAGLHARAVAHHRAAATSGAARSATAPRTARLLGGHDHRALSRRARQTAPVPRHPQRHHAAQAGRGAPAGAGGPHPARSARRRRGPRSAQSAGGLKGALQVLARDCPTIGRSITWSRPCWIDRRAQRSGERHLLYAGTTPPQIECVALEALLVDAAISATAATGSRHRIEIDASDLTVSADRHMLHEAIVNLLVNACQATNGPKPILATTRSCRGVVPDRRGRPRAWDSSGAASSRNSVLTPQMKEAASVVSIVSSR